MIASCAVLVKILSVHSSMAHFICTEVALCDHGTVRLVDGSSEAEGAVQLCINGVWGSISSPWRFPEARVICKMLGYDEYGIAILCICLLCTHFIMIINFISQELYPFHHFLLPVEMILFCQPMFIVLGMKRTLLTV